jgi:hypothetical protein
MKVAHWIRNLRSGMNTTGDGLCEAERKLGLDSNIVLVDVPETHERASAADVHVLHSHMTPEAFYATQRGKGKLVYIPHGTPEHVFTESINDSRNGYGHSDGWMLAQHWLRTSDAVVTFWPRHEAIWRSMADKNKKVYCLPMGIDLDRWQRVAIKQKWLGEPSLFSAENSYQIKWALDLLIMWPWIVADPKLHGAKLHCTYIPTDQHRWFFPLVNQNGASFSSYLSALSMSSDSLRQAFTATDYYIGLVRYGDFNNMSLQAAAIGTKVISYEGNPYSHYWVKEGDQRRIAEDLKAILKGEVEARTPNPVISIMETASQIKEIYEQL